MMVNILFCCLLAFEFVCLHTKKGFFEEKNKFFSSKFEQKGQISKYMSYIAIMEELTPIEAIKQSSLFELVSDASLIVKYHKIIDGLLTRKFVDKSSAYNCLGRSKQCGHHQFNLLEESGLIEKKGRHYEVTEKTKTIIQALHKMDVSGVKLKIK